MNIYNIFKFIIELLGSKPMKSDKVLTTFDEIIEITLPRGWICYTTQKI